MAETSSSSRLCNAVFILFQLKLLSTIAYKLYNLSKALTFKSNEADPSTTFPVKPLNNTAGDALKQIDTHSVSSASTVDQVDAFSTLTGSTSMFAKPKVWLAFNGIWKIYLLSVLFIFKRVWMLGSLLL